MLTISDFFKGTNLQHFFSSLLNEPHPQFFKAQSPIHKWPPATSQYTLQELLTSNIKVGRSKTTGVLMIAPYQKLELR